MNITLIGMPGVGKSVVGERVAERLGLAFVDLDKLLERQHGKPLQRILDEAGEEGFLTLEEGAALGLESLENTLVSPGGSIVYSDRAMAHLRERSTVVFLDAPIGEIRARLTMEGRGIVRGGDRGLEAIYEERLPLYQKYAHVTVPIEGVDTEENAARIIEALGIQ